MSESAVLIAPAVVVVESAAEAEPGVIVTVGVGEVETTLRGTLADGLLEREAMRVFAETTAADIGYLIAWHEGRDEEFVQAALTGGRTFLVEVHDASTDPGLCLAVDGVGPGEVARVMRSWLLGRLEVSVGTWRVVPWRK